MVDQQKCYVTSIRFLVYKLWLDMPVAINWCTLLSHFQQKSCELLKLFKMQECVYLIQNATRLKIYELSNRRFVGPFIILVRATRNHIIPVLLDFSDTKE